MKKAISRFSGIYRRIKMPWLWVILSAIFLSLEASFMTGAATLTGSLIDASKQAIKPSLLIEFVVNILFYGMMTAVAAYVQPKTAEMINVRSRKILWNKIMKLPTRFYDQDEKNELVSRVTADANSVGDTVTVVTVVVISIYNVINIFIKLFKIHTKLALYAMLALPVFFAISYGYAKLNYWAGFKANAYRAAGLAYIVDRVRNLRLIKSKVMESKESAEGKTFFRKMFNADQLVSLSISVFQITQQIFAISFMIIAFMLGGQLMAAGEITAGNIMSFYSLTGVIGLRLSLLSMYLGNVADVYGRLKKVGLIFDAEEEQEDGAAVPEENNNIVFENVTFGYNPNEPVINQLSFEIPKGSFTAIVGTNGAGKSTVAKLLTRVYEPDEGTIRFGGININEFSMTEWRNKFSVVSQNNPLLMGTVRENILYGIKREVSEEELIAVAKAANCYDFIMEKPNGFDEMVGMDGSNFSGGQQQCIAIARAMLRNCPYLLFDEATSNLDVKSEQQVTDAFEELIKNKTAIVIAHRAAAVKKADRIIVMRDGRIEAIGTPEQVAKTNEYYRLFIQENISNQENI